SAPRWKDRLLWPLHRVASVPGCSDGWAQSNELAPLCFFQCCRRDFMGNLLWPSSLLLWQTDRDANATRWISAARDWHNHLCWRNLVHTPTRGGTSSKGRACFPRSSEEPKVETFRA